MVTFKPMIARVSVCFWLSKDYEYDYEDCAMCITLIYDSLAFMVSGLGAAGLGLVA